MNAHAAGPAVVLGTDLTVVGQATLGGSAAAAGQATVVSGRPQIADVDTAPLGAPVALIRGGDGLFRPDRPAIAARPTRTEVDAAIGVEVAAHVIDPAPHPAYDDIPSLSLLFENRLV